MKKLALLFTAAILIISGCSKTDDLLDENMPGKQLKSADTRTVNSYFNPSAPDAYFPLECDGVEVDWLEPYDGSIKAHIKTHYQKGKMKWMQINVKGSAKSKYTGEIYKINELNKLYFNENEELIDFHVRTHASGDHGNNIIIFTRVIDFHKFIFEIEKAICTEK